MHVPAIGLERELRFEAAQGGGRCGGRSLGYGVGHGVAVPEL